MKKFLGSLLMLVGLASAQTMYMVNGSPNPTAFAGYAVAFTVQFNTSSPLASWFIFDASPSGQAPYTSVANSCDVSYNSGWTGGGNLVGWALVNDAGNNVTYPDSNGRTSNSQCTFYKNYSGFATRNIGSGITQVTMTYEMSFSPAVNGQIFDIYVYGAIGGKCGYTGVGCSGWQKVGTWTASWPTAALPVVPVLQPQVATADNQGIGFFPPDLPTSFSNSPSFDFVPTGYVGTISTAVISLTTGKPAPGQTVYLTTGKPFPASGYHTHEEGFRLSNGGYGGDPLRPQAQVLDNPQVTDVSGIATWHVQFPGATNPKQAFAGVHWFYVYGSSSCNCTPGSTVFEVTDPAYSAFGFTSFDVSLSYTRGWKTIYFFDGNHSFEEVFGTPAFVTKLYKFGIMYEAILWQNMQTGNPGTDTSQYQPPDASNFIQYLRGSLPWGGALDNLGQYSTNPVFWDPTNPDPHPNGQAADVTFNSENLVVSACFLGAAKKAGFVSYGLAPQQPLDHSYQIYHMQ